MLKPTIVALAAVALAAAPASASAGAHDRLPDAEIFATDNTAVITDPDDPRLRDELTGFAHRVERIVERGGGSPRGSRLLDGVFFSADQGTTTFERSRRFDVDGVADDELHAIADEVRGRFGQQSVLTFDHLPPGDDEVDAIELEVPGVSARALRDGLLADQTAREELFGGSVTLGGRLLLVAELADAELARAFAERIGGDLRRAETHYGEREFVDGPAPVRVEQRTLIVSGSADDETVALRDRLGRLEIDLDADGTADFDVEHRRFDRVRAGRSPTSARCPCSARRSCASLRPRRPTASRSTGTDGDDELAVTGRVVVAGTATLTGLPATVNLTHTEGASDTLAIDTRAGDDTVDTSGLPDGTIALEVD